MGLFAVVGREVRRFMRVCVLALLSTGVVLAAAHATVPSGLDQLAMRLIQGPSPADQGGVAFANPLPGRAVASPFGLREMPWEAQGRLHAGVDIPAPQGEPVEAVAPGVVMQAGDSSSYGRYVEIRHPDGLVSVYAHLSGQADRARPGAQLAAGDVIGFVGSTGHATGPHLHLEIRRNGVPLDPQRFLGHRFARETDLPLADAARYPAGVRMASVSGG